VSLVYFGTSEFACPALERIRDRVSLVVTQPARPKGRGLQPVPSPVERAARSLNLPVETPPKCRAPEFLERVQALQPEALIVAAYGQILPEALLAVARHGGINLHASLLPKYRGAAPIQRAVLEGVSHTGVTLMQMDAGLDTGDIILARRTPIGQDETAGELEARLALIAADLLEEMLPQILTGDYPRTPQAEAEATYAPKVPPEEGLLDWGESAEAAYRRFRATTPRPGARLPAGSEPVLVTRARLGGGQGVPGQVLGFREDALEVAFGGGSLLLDRVKPPGKREMTGREFASGRRLKAGDRLESRRDAP